MTEKQIIRLSQALKNTSRNQFAQPQQSEYIRLSAIEHKMPATELGDFLVDIAPILNASAILQVLKKRGVIASEMSAKEKAEAELMLKTLKA